MTLYALAESRAVMQFYQALASGKLAAIYEKYWAYKDSLEEIRKESIEKERKIDAEYRKRIK